MQDLVRRHPKTAALLALALAGLAAYANALAGSFHYDDMEGIVQNLSLRDLKNIPSYFVDPIIFRFTSRLDWRPILQTTYALDYAIGGPGPAMFHVTNVVFHVGAAWLIFLIVAALAEKPAARLPPATFVSRFWIALVPALLFTVHTVNSQTVDYIWARSSLLAAFFYLLAFYCHLRGPFGSPERRRPLWHAGALGAFALALGSKATAVSLPGMLLAYEVLLLNPAGQNPLRLYFKEPRRLVKYIPTLVVLLAYTWLRMDVTPRTTRQFFSGPWINRTAYLLTQFRAWVYYLKLYLWPDPLILDYPGFGWSTSLWDWRVLLSLALVLMLLAAAWRARRREPVLSFFTLWFFIALLPESSVIVRPDAVTGHRPYLAYAGLSVAAAVLSFKAAGALRRRWLAGWPEGRFRLAYGVALGLVVVALTAATIRRNLDWRDEVTLWSDVVRKDPGNARAYRVLGVEYTEREDYAKAGEMLAKAIELAPRNLDAYLYRGNLNLLLGKYDDALADLNRSMEKGGRSPFNFFYRGELYRQTGRYDEALKDYRSALALNGRFPDAYFGIAMVHWQRKELAQATTACAKLLDLDRDNRRSYICLGSLLMHQGRFGEAMKIYYNGVARFPENSTLWYGLGTAYEELGLYKEAQLAYGNSNALAGGASEPQR